MSDETEDDIEFDYDDDEELCDDCGELMEDCACDIEEADDE